MWGDVGERTGTRERWVEMGECGEMGETTNMRIEDALGEGGRDAPKRRGREKNGGGVNRTCSTPAEGSALFRYPPRCSVLLFDAAALATAVLVSVMASIVVGAAVGG